MTTENKSKATGLRFGHFWSRGFVAPRPSEDDRIEVFGQGMREDVGKLKINIVIDDESITDPEILDCDILDEEF